VKLLTAAARASLLACALGCAGRASRPGAGAPVVVLRAERPAALDGTQERVLAVADDGTRRVLLTDQAAWVLRGSAAERTAGGRAWTTAALIPAADGRGTWCVGLDEGGRLLRVRPGAELEEISDRYGLGHTRIRAVAPAGGRLVAFLLDDVLAIADGRRVLRYPAPGARSLGAGARKVALVLADRVDTFDLAPLLGRKNDQVQRRSYAVRDALAAGVDSRGELVVATRTAAFRTQDAVLRLLYRADSAAGIAWMAVAGTRVWLVDGDTLLVADEGPVAVAQGGPEAAVRAAAAAGDGSLWVLGDSGAARFVPDRPSAAEARWDEAVRPRFARACGECHAADGKSGVDLSTAAAWLASRDEIQERVVARRTMPPTGRVLSEDDRSAIARWLRSTAR
jgi:mono/diheme cytochrome c family protein